MSSGTTLLLFFITWQISSFFFNRAYEKRSSLSSSWAVVEYHLLYKDFFLPSPCVDRFYINAEVRPTPFAKVYSFTSRLHRMPTLKLFSFSRLKKFMLFSFPFRPPCEKVSELCLHPFVWRKNAERYRIHILRPSP